MPYYGSHDTSIKVAKQISWTESAKSKIWARIVKEKIYRQYTCLYQFNRETSEKLFDYIVEIEDGDKTNREGHAAKVYFNSLFGLDFSRTQDNFINASLNYGYSIILSSICREIVSIGCITQIGIFHKNRFNEFNLGCDLMEPFRPIVDNYVAKSRITDELNSERKLELVNLLNSDVRITGIKTSLLNALSIYVKSVIDALEKEDEQLIKFIDYEF